MLEQIAPDQWAVHTDQWQDEQAAPWGQLLYSTSHLNIQRHLDGRALQVLDVGGGNGMDTIWLARQGHAVTLVDSSEKLLALARKAAAECGVVERITIVHADASAIGELMRGQQFDLILCHLMLEFAYEPLALLKDICGLLAPGGLFSLIDTNRYSLAFRIPYRTGNLREAARAIGSREYFHPWVNRTTNMFSADEAIRALIDNGCELVGQYGIRCICDYLPDELKAPEAFAELEQLEHRMTDAFPYYLLARFYQVIVRK